MKNLKYIFKQNTDMGNMYPPEEGYNNLSA